MKMKSAASFVAGMAVMAILTSLIITAAMIIFGRNILSLFISHIRFHLFHPIDFSVNIESKRLEISIGCDIIEIP